MGDYINWVERQTRDSNVRYFPILNADQASQKYDELVITVSAQTNPNYFDIYVKLNGAYNKARRDTGVLAESL